MSLIFLCTKKKKKKKGRLKTKLRLVLRGFEAAPEILNFLIPIFTAKPEPNRYNDRIFGKSREPILIQMKTNPKRQHPADFIVATPALPPTTLQLVGSLT